MKKEIEITSPDKILFPKDKIKKIGLIDYYLNISSLMLPYLQDRLLSVIRCHDNIEKETFFKKHPQADKLLVNVFKDKGEEYFYINKDYQLIYQVQNGTIEFHTSGKPIKLGKPSIMVFDLDPDDKLPLEKLRNAVGKVKWVLDELNLVSFLKTSGGKGYHIVVPFQNCKNWESFYDFSRQVAKIIESKWSEDFTTNLKKSERKGKIFIDYLRNNKSSTCVAPFSVRARKGAPVSMPIPWSSLNKIRPNEINIKNYKDYINDSWKDFFKIKQKLK